jgi:serine/threonine protein kinase
VPGYERLEEVGRGGMGVVYKAWQRDLNRPVALKMILDGRLASGDDLHRFRIEAENVARLKHEGIVQVYAIDKIGGDERQPFIVMELLASRSLARRLREFVGNPRAAAELMKAAAEAVQHAHEHGVIHRDLKPSNILFDTDAAPKVADFGLAKRLPGPTPAPGAPVSQPGGLIGTLDYMAPEQAGGADATGRTDVYGLGAVLYELLTGMPPCRGETAAEKLRQVLHVEPQPPWRLRRGVPRDLEAACLKCLENDPYKRYASAAALADDLRRFLAGAPTQARPGNPATRALKWVRRRPVWAALYFLLLAAAGLSALSVWLYVRGLAQERDHADEKERMTRNQNDQLTAERDKARQESERAKLAFGVISQMMVQTARDERRDLPPAGKKPVLAQAVAPLLQSLEMNGAADPDQRALLGQFCIRVGDDSGRRES